MGCLHSFCIDSVLKKHKRLCGNHDYCRVDMPEEGKNILRNYSWEKSLKAPFTLYADFECLLVKEQSCQNNPEKSYTERKDRHEPSGYSLSLICSFDSTKNKHYVYRGKDCVEHFCRKLKELGTEIINYEKKGGAAHSTCNLSYNVAKKIPIIIHNHLTYDDHFKIKQFSEEFEGQFKF